MRGRVLGPIVLLILLSGSGRVAGAAESTAEAAAVYSQWVDTMVEFTRGVEIDEKGMRAFLDHWQALSELEVIDSDEEDAAGLGKNLEEALADSRYRAWAQGRGLEPKAFLQKSMRIMSLYMMQQAAGQEAQAAQQFKEFAAMVEQQCARADAQTCGQMRQGLAESKAMAVATKKARQKLTPPTSREKTLLGRHATELEKLMLEDNAESEDGEDDYGGRYSEDQDEGQDEEDY